MIRGQVLHQHKGHARLDLQRHAREKGFKSGQPAGRGANPHDRKDRFRDWNRDVGMFCFAFSHFFVLDGMDAGLAGLFHSTCCRFPQQRIIVFNNIIFLVK